MDGFTFPEILIGLIVLALTFVSLSAYTASQRKGLHKSGQLADGTQVAATALETMRGRLADSSTFADLYRDAKTGPKSIESQRTVNNLPYKIDLIVTRAPSPLYALQVTAKVSWKSTHGIQLGMLYPGAASTL